MVSIMNFESRSQAIHKTKRTSLGYLILQGYSKDVTMNETLYARVQKQHHGPET